jgi:hypothetical protein
MYEWGSLRLASCYTDHALSRTRKNRNLHIPPQSKQTQVHNQQENGNKHDSILMNILYQGSQIVHGQWTIESYPIVSISGMVYYPK